MHISTGVHNSVHEHIYNVIDKNAYTHADRYEGFIFFTFSQKIAIFLSFIYTDTDNWNLHVSLFCFG